MTTVTEINRGLTPKRIVAELDKYIVGQDDAKRAVAVALRNRYRRRQLDDEMREDVIPKNILMIGPTGVGKTEIARRLASLAGAPFIKVEATKFTEVGYVGRDVDSMVRDLTELAVQAVEQEHFERVHEQAEARANDRILDQLCHPPEPPRRKRSAQAALESLISGVDPDNDELSPAEEETYRRQLEQSQRLREKLAERLERGELEDREVEVEVEENRVAFARIFSGQGLEEMGFDVSGMLGQMLGPRDRKRRRTTVAEARRILTQEEAESLIDRDRIVREAVQRVEELGIIFIDELDKVAGREGGQGPDVSREGVQRDILPIVEGSTVITKYGPVRTHHVLFVAAGAFHVSKPSDLIPELQGRFPIRVELDSLTHDDLKRILTEPKNSLIRQYTALLAVEGVQLEFTPEAIDHIATIAENVNDSMENIGARRLHTVMERLLDDLSFSAPDNAPAQVTIDPKYVDEKLGELVEDVDESRYIL